MNNANIPIIVASSSDLERVLLNDNSYDRETWNGDLNLIIHADRTLGQSESTLVEGILAMLALVSGSAFNDFPCNAGSNNGLDPGPAIDFGDYP